MGSPVRSVYVHAPFCVRRCVYCDFAVTVRPEGDVSGWCGALAAELTWIERERLFELAPCLETVYVGGGTPSLLGPHAMRELAGVLGADRLTRPGLEWTAEANPESFTPDVARGWSEAGVNRVSLGAQTFHEGALRWMGRMHGPEGVARAAQAAKSVGITNVSIDLIFGLPRKLGRSWSEDLECGLELDVPHVSLYGLGIEPGTPLGRAVAEGREPAIDEEQYREEFLEASERLTGAGYEHYEVSNFARPGYASRHNRVYWDGRPYLGIGNGAHSYAHPVRRWNVRDWASYRTRVLEGRAPEEGRERLDDEATELERLWLGLRTRQGLELASLDCGACPLIESWERSGLAAVDDGRVRLTPVGWLELDRLAVELESFSGRASLTPRDVG